MIKLIPTAGVAFPLFLRRQTPASSREVHKMNKKYRYCTAKSTEKQSQTALKSMLHTCCVLL